MSICDAMFHRIAIHALSRHRRRYRRMRRRTGRMLINPRARVGVLPQRA